MDYTCIAGTATFPIGSVQNDVEPATVDIIADNRVENDENFFGDLTDGGATGVMIEAGREQTTVTIVDVTVAQFGWQLLTYSFDESDGTVSLNVQLRNNVVLDRALDVQFGCTSGTATGK